jgi:hypothetical protein
VIDKIRKTNFLFQCGVIECVPNSRSREDIGRNTEVGLFEYFRHIYGKDDSIKFQKVIYFRWKNSDLLRII